MAGPTESRHGMWSNRWLFVLAAAGSAVGLGNIWKFPYIAGENGGGAFVILYLACIAFVGIPIMMAEVLIGREGRQSPINTMRQLIKQHHRHPAWVLIGWAGVVAGFLILSYYVVIAGWALYYILQMGSGALEGASAEQAGALFSDFLASPLELMFWQTLFMVLTVYIISKGVISGLETAVRWFMPMLFVLMAVLLGYAVTSDGWSQGVVIRELAQLYPAFLAGQPSPLGPLAIQYRDFAAWQRQWLRGPQLAAQLDYWRSQLGSG